MTTITKFTKEQLIATAKEEIASRRYMIESGEWGAEVVGFYKRKLALSEIALASLTVAPVVPDEKTDNDYVTDCHGVPSLEDCAHQRGWNDCRASMLQDNQRDLSQPIDPQVAKYEQIMLQAGNSPVTPDGYALVPVEPTDEMIAAAMECDDVVFDSKDPAAFCVQYREIYCSMLAAAPTQTEG